MKKFPYISLHPKLAAGLELVLGFVWLTFLPQIDFWWKLLIWGAVRLVWWAILIRLVFYSTGLSRFKHFFSLALFNVGIVSYIVFIDQLVTRQIVEVLAVALPAISLWLLPSTDLELSFALKPERRWRFFLSVLGLSGVWSGIIAGRAFGVYFIHISWLVAVATLITGAVSAWWWWEYALPVSRRFWESLAVIMLLTFEAAWAVTVSPLGYFEGGLVITWLWYTLWLLMRFHISPDGIVWRKQIVSFVINGAGLVALITLVARWK
jgi:hypothetical protein